MRDAFIPEATAQEEGGPDRLFLGIDGTMGDAQDVNHPYLASVYGCWCRVCGLAEKYRRHTARIDGSGGQTETLGNPHRDGSGDGDA